MTSRDPKGQGRDPQYIWALITVRDILSVLIDYLSEPHIANGHVTDDVTWRHPSRDPKNQGHDPDIFEA